MVLWLSTSLQSQCLGPALGMTHGHPVKPQPVLP